MKIWFSTLDGVSERDDYFRRIKVVPKMQIYFIAHEKSLALVQTWIAGLIGGRSSTELAGPGLCLLYNTINFLLILVSKSV